MFQMKIREPDVAVEEITADHRRRKRSAMQPDVSTYKINKVLDDTT